jgi:hypothetical protein
VVNRWNRATSRLSSMFIRIRAPTPRSLGPFQRFKRIMGVIFADLGASILAAGRI